MQCVISVKQSKACKAARQGKHLDAIRGGLNSKEHAIC
jgi:hypothetical protein